MWLLSSWLPCSFCLLWWLGLRWGLSLWGFRFLCKNLRPMLRLALRLHRHSCRLHSRFLRWLGLLNFRRIWFLRVRGRWKFKTPTNCSRRHSSFLTLCSCQPERAGSSLACSLHQLPSGYGSLQIPLYERRKCFSIHLVICCDVFLDGLQRRATFFIQILDDIRHHLRSTQLNRLCSQFLCQRLCLLRSRFNWEWLCSIDKTQRLLVASDLPLM